MIHTYKSMATRIAWCGISVTADYPEPGSATMALSSTKCVECFEACWLWNMLDRERNETQ